MFGDEYENGMDLTLLFRLVCICHGMDGCSEAFGCDQRFRLHVGDVVGLYDSIVTCIAIRASLLAIEILQSSKYVSTLRDIVIPKYDLSESGGNA